MICVSQNEVRTTAGVRRLYRGDVMLNLTQLRQLDETEEFWLTDTPICRVNYPDKRKSPVVWLLERDNDVIRLSEDFRWPWRPMKGFNDEAFLEHYGVSVTDQRVFWHHWDKQLRMKLPLVTV